MAIPGQMRLSELAAKIQQVISQSFSQQRYWVLADVIDHKYYERTGTHFFSLAEKEPGTTLLKTRIASVAWKETGSRAIASFEKATGQSFGNDIQVLVYVSVNFHPSFGLQLVLNDIDIHHAIGVLEQQRRDTLKRLLVTCPDYIYLKGDQFITRNKLCSLAPVIQRIAILSSAQAAGYQDFLDTLIKNRFGYRFQVDNYFASVQGASNAEVLCQKLIAIHRTGIPYDAIVIIRGGGSQSDLLLFDQYELARTVAKFPIPIITGIGHQINETLVDLMAHTSVKTPSIAAEFIIGHNQGFESALLQLQQQIIIRSQQRITMHRQELSQLHISMNQSIHRLIQGERSSINEQYQKTIRLGQEILHRNRYKIQEKGNILHNRPGFIIEGNREALKRRDQELVAAARNLLRNRKMQLEQEATVCRLADPQRILKRGFALIYKNDGIVQNADEVDIDSTIKVQFFDSSLNAIITTKHTTDGTNIEL